MTYDLDTVVDFAMETFKQVAAQHQDSSVAETILRKQFPNIDDDQFVEACECVVICKLKEDAQQSKCVSP
jgi:hypothetical protein